MTDTCFGLRKLFVQLARPPWILAFLLVCLLQTGCAALFLQTDAFPEKLAGGCSTEEACQRLVGEAESRVVRCQPNTIGYIRCADAEADANQARRLLQWIVNLERREAAAKETALHERLARLRAIRDAAEARDASRRKGAEKQAKLAAEEEEAEHAWGALDAKECALEGDSEACLRLRTFTAKYPASRRAPEASAALAQGEPLLREIQRLVAQKMAAEVEQRERARPHAEKQNVAEEEGRARARQVAEQQRVARARPTGGASTPPTLESGPRSLRCCDGTSSPTCLCGRSRRGCCSHHGGVCGCE